MQFFQNQVTALDIALIGLVILGCCNNTIFIELLIIFVFGLQH